MKPLQQWTPATQYLLSRRARRMVFLNALRGVVLFLASMTTGLVAPAFLPGSANTLRFCVAISFLTIAIASLFWSIRQIQTTTWLTIARHIESGDPRFEHRLVTLVSVDLRGESSPLVHSLRDETEQLAANHLAGASRPQ